MESFLTTVAELIREKQLPALMIGGHAVTALGHPRATFDLDLLIPRGAAHLWKSELSKLGYRTYAETTNFLQFEPLSGLPLPPVDLMLVDGDVFQSLNAGKSDHLPIATPHVMAMIALKLHAINQPARENTAQDWSDVIALTKAHHLTLDDPEFSSIVMKHGGEIATAKINAALTGGS
jgi:hypothetical protein